MVSVARVSWYLLKFGVILLVNPSLHRTATFVPPLSDQENGQDAQWSPIPRKFGFCETAAARSFCLPWTTKAAVVAQKVAQRRQSGGRTIAKVADGLPWSPNGGTVVATVIAQWTLLVGQRRHNHGGTRKAEALLKLIHNVHNSTYYLRDDQWPTTVHPFCHHGDVCAFLLPPLSDLWVTDLLGDLCATVLNMLKTLRRPWRPWRCLNALCTTIERPRQLFCFLSAFNSDLASFVVAQWRQNGRSPCVKGVLVISSCAFHRIKQICTTLSFFIIIFLWYRNSGSPRQWRAVQSKL